MILIYVVPDAANLQTKYICDSQLTIDSRPINPKTGEFAIPANLCSVGNESDANALLATNQQTWLTKQASLFTCNIQTMVEGGVVWTVVNLVSEPANTDRQYFVLDPTTGLYTEAIGLTAAQNLLQQTQQKYLVFTNMNSYITMTSWA